MKKAMALALSIFTTSGFAGMMAPSENSARSLRAVIDSFYVSCHFTNKIQNIQLLKDGDVGAQSTQYEVHMTSGKVIFEVRRSGGQPQGGGENFTAVPVSGNCR